MPNSSSIFDELMNFSLKDKNSSIGGEGKKKVKKKPSEQLLSDIKSFGFDMTQLGTVLKTKGNQLIVSCAGSGKTTSIIFKIIYDLKSGRSTVLKSINDNSVRVPEKIWVATFLKSGADELKNSYRRWCNKLHCADMSQAIQFSTLHAEFKRVLNMLGLKTEIISDSENKTLLKKVLKVYNVKSSNGGFIKDEEVNSLIGAFTRTRNRLDGNRYIANIYDDLNLVDSVIDCILRDWKNERILINKVDFEDLQELLYDYCYNKKDPGIIKFLANRFNYIYIDEFQDTSQLQYALLKVYGCDAKQIVAIGDDDQTIYSWRGSDNSIITSEFMKDFSPIKTDLSVNFRCPSNILNAIKPSIRQNKMRFDKALKSYNDGGKVRYGEYAGYKHMAVSLGDLVYNDVKNGLSVAILCRVNSDGLLPALMFDKMGRFSFSVSGANMTLDSYVGRLCFSIIRLMTDKFSADVRRALGYLTYDSYGITRLVDVCRNNNKSIWTIDENDLVYSSPEVADKILSWRDFRKVNGDIPTLKLIIQDYRYNVFTKETQFNDVVKSVLISIESLLDYYDYSSADDFLMELIDINERLKAREKKFNSQVKIATVHEFKGKEADSVYIWNDSIDVFPFKKSVDAIDNFEEERRIHYIACTRAKKSSTIMYLKNKKGLFVSEMDLSKAEKLEGQTSGVFKKELNTSMQEKANTKKVENIINNLSDDDIFVVS